MAVIKWSDEFSVNIKEMDEQHKKTIHLYSSIIEAEDKKPERELMNYVSELIEHWKMHFEYEEDLMKEYKYSGLTEHKKEHEDIMNNFSNLEGMYSYGFEYVISCVTPHLQFWVDEHVGHTDGEDKKLGEYLKSKGMT